MERVIPGAARDNPLHVKDTVLAKKDGATTRGRLITKKIA
jgi:hypothetical protein